MFLVFAVVTSLLISISSSNKKETLDCDVSAKNPSRATLKQMYNEWLGVNESTLSSFDLQPAFYKAKYKKVFSENKFILRWRIYGNPKCYKKLNRSSGTLMDISLCPWFLEMTYDPERYPESMANARCKCKHCYDKDGNRHRRSKRSDILRCKGIKQMIKVLRIQKNYHGEKVCQPNNNKLFLYKGSFEEINTACTCVLENEKRIQQVYIKTGS